MRTVGGPQIEVFSAGSQPSELHPLAIEVMQERGINIRGQQSTHMDAYVDQHLNYVVTVCDRAREVCPVFPDHPDETHWSIPDPASATGSQEERLQVFHAVADQIEQRVLYFLSFIHHQRAA